MSQRQFHDFGTIMLGKPADKVGLSNELANNLLELLGEEYKEFVERIRHTKFGSYYCPSKHITDVYFASNITVLSLVIIFIPLICLSNTIAVSGLASSPTSMFLI